MEEKFQIADMEQELLGALLIRNGQAIPKVAAILSPNDFSKAIFGDVYQIILDLYNAGNVPTILSIYNAAQKHPNFDGNEKIFREVIVLLGDVAYTNAYAEDFAKTIKENAIRRRALRFTQKLQRDLDDPKKETADILSYAENAFRNFDGDIAPTALISPNAYFTKRFDADIESTKRYATRKTGFSNIDEQQIFSPGLYVMGATPACGKTTFAWQLLSQLAQNGEHCIFCSYEMSALELHTKTLARELFLRDKKSALTAADIRRGSYNATLKNLVQEFKDDQKLKGVYVFEMRDETVDDLLRLLRPHCTGKDKAPVVCVDYLQIIPAANDKKLISDKAKIDDIVHKLKTFQRETNTTFIVISSFNRMNYYSQISFESFKESGNIEYSGDGVWGLQLAAVDTIKPGAGNSEVRKHFEEAKREQPRSIQFKCLKNRQGNNYDCGFNYFSAHDFFEVDKLFNMTLELPTDEGKQNIETVDFEDI